jgi:hypothetical protein
VTCLKAGSGRSAPLAVPAGDTLVDNFENVRILPTGGRPAEHPPANGRGFNQASVKGNGHGLRNMAARTQKIGGATHRPVKGELGNTRRT